MAKLAGIYITNETETFTPSVEVTQHPVEQGVAITDHVQKNNRTISVTGMLLAKDSATAERNYNTLLAKMESGAFVTYVGRTYAANYLITSMPKDYSIVKNGFGISIELQQVRIAKSPWVKKKTTVQVKAKKSTAKPKTSTAKKFHKIKKGECYWILARKYGTNLNTLMGWKENKWPARRIPIGVMVRVK
ncbi:phage baseplate protein [Listeria booriae]|uniref:phage baseplate protein n=1 Tax=Listeria booriae TaxID=1552123 RepID=UPI00163D8DC9|nr:LysM domain-containing protein [Listeria booriae]MBC1307889.1 LysM domain-containing protein [Listeria booriae]